MFSDWTPNGNLRHSAMFTYEFRFLKVSFLLFGLASFRTDRSSDASDANNIWATAWAGICIAYSLDSFKITKNFVAYASTYQIRWN